MFHGFYIRVVTIVGIRIGFFFYSYWCFPRSIFFFGIYDSVWSTAGSNWEYLFGVDDFYISIFLSKYCFYSSCEIASTHRKTYCFCFGPRGLYLIWFFKYFKSRRDGI